MKKSTVEFYVKSRSMRVCTHDRGGFSSIRNENILLYWPHGFGDLVGLGYVLPLLEPSNRYWLTRFGDDYLSVMDGSEYITPLFAGSPPATQCGDGDCMYIRHFGMQYDAITGSEQTLSLPASIDDACKKNRIRTILWTSYPETFGSKAYPYHTKARNLARHIACLSSMPILESGIPLTNAINFDVSPWILRWVEARLRNLTGFGDRKLCIISRNGYTATGKNWGHRWREDLPPDQRREAYECREFMRLLLKRDRHWVFVTMEDRLFQGDDTVRSRDLHCFSYAELFGIPAFGSTPFGLVTKALVRLASLAIGVPTGPFHLCMANRSLPTVGIWLLHSPSWYEEARDGCIHLIGNEAATNPRCWQVVQNNGTNRSQQHNAISSTRNITANQVLHAVETLLY